MGLNIYKTGTYNRNLRVVYVAITGKPFYDEIENNVMRALLLCVAVTGKTM